MTSSTLIAASRELLLGDHVVWRKDPCGGGPARFLLGYKPITGLKFNGAFSRPVGIESPIFAAEPGYLPA